MRKTATLIVLRFCSHRPCVWAGRTQTSAPTRKPAPAAPATKPAPPAKPEPPPPPSDIRFKSKYTTGDQVTESVTYIRGNRERYEIGDMILLRQHD